MYITRLKPSRLMSHHIHIMFTILGQVWIPIGGQAQVLLLHRPGRTGRAPGQHGSGIPQYFYSQS